MASLFSVFSNTTNGIHIWDISELDRELEDLHKVISFRCFKLTEKHKLFIQFIKKEFGLIFSFNLHENKNTSC